MLKKNLESKLLKIERKAMKANEKDYRIQLKEAKKAKTFNAFGETWQGELYIMHSAADRVYFLKSLRLNKAKKENNLKKFKEVFIKLLEKKYKEELKTFGIKWAKGAMGFILILKEVRYCLQEGSARSASIVYSN